MDKNQGLTWELLLILGIVVLLMSPVGDWLGSIVSEIATHHNMNLTFNPLDRSGTTVTPGTGIKGGSSGSSSSTSLFNVPIVDASGGAGTIQVVANNAQSAVGNASQGGNTATGPATAA